MPMMPLHGKAGGLSVVHSMPTRRAFKIQYAPLRMRGPAHAAFERMTLWIMGARWQSRLCNTLHHFNDGSGSRSSL
jgi:hypothetical protein